MSNSHRGAMSRPQSGEQIDDTDIGALEEALANEALYGIPQKLCDHYDYTWQPRSLGVQCCQRGWIWAFCQTLALECGTVLLGGMLA